MDLNQLNAFQFMYLSSFPQPLRMQTRTLACVAGCWWESPSFSCWLLCPSPYGCALRSDAGQFLCLFTTLQAKLPAIVELITEDDLLSLFSVLEMFTFCADSSPISCIFI